MCAAIREFGFRIPVVARSDGSVVDGHLRLKAARRLGLKHVPVALADELSDAQIKAFRLLANRSASWAEWDNDLLVLELQDLKDANFDLTLTGFGVDELASILDEPSAAGLTDEDAVPALNADPVTKPGDLIILGEHRLLCGDATNVNDVGRLLDGRRPHLMVTDPPYGVEYDPAWRNERGISTSRRIGAVKNDDRADWREAWALFPGNVAYVWHASLFVHTVAESLVASNFDLRAHIIWAKDRLQLSRGHYHWQHEPCWYAVRKGAQGHWSGDRKQTTLWEITHKGQDTATVHGTQKPVACMQRPIINNSVRGDLIYDPFAGSGTTVIAAETTGRRCMALEIDPAYCDLIVARWEAFTGHQADRSSGIN
jgi:DNA modification methylase